jgi:ubiquinone/menaquinone biosynthesis C-methylase UbiE
MLNRKTVAMTNTARQAGAGTVLQELTRSFYNGRTDAGHRYSSEAWLARYAEELLALMPSGGTLLDVGCGSCQITTYLAAAFDRVVAFEPSDSMREAALERSELVGAYNVQVLKGDAVCFPPEAEQADVILTNGVIQYLDKAALCTHLLECGRVLNPGGTILWALIPDANLRRLWYLGALTNPRPPLRRMIHRYAKIQLNWWKAKRRGDILWDEIGLWFTREELRAVAEEMGFAVEFRNSWFYEYRFAALLTRPVEKADS